MILDLDRVTKLAEERGISPKRVARQLREMERALKRRIVFGGGGPGFPLLYDRGFIRRFGKGAGKTYEARLHVVEEDMAEVKTVLYEHLGVTIGEG